MTTALATKSAADLVRERSGANVLLCYQCKKCTLGCPMSSHMDVMPNQVIRLLQFDRLDEALRTNSIWLCASCQTCSTRCPSGIEVAQVMDALRVIAQERGMPAKVPAETTFINAGLRSINGLGRMYELGLMAEMNLRTGQIFKDMDMGLKMFLAGRLKLVPQRAGFPGKLRKTAAPAGAIAYYPGCSLHASAGEYDRSLRAVAKSLGLELREPKGWVCCGSTPAHWKSEELAQELPLRNLALIESKGYGAVSVPCAMCFSRLKFAEHESAHDASVNERLGRKLGYEYRHGVSVENAIDTFVNRVGLDALAKQTKRPLSGLKLVCYYGCLLTRPPGITGADRPEYPMSMDRLLRAMGAETLDWSYKTDCCGGSLSIIDTDKCLDLIQRIVDNARALGADAIAVACPMCHANLDGRQAGLAKREGRAYDMPVLYFTQLMALALGLGHKPAAVDGHLVDARALLRTKGLLD